MLIFLHTSDNFVEGKWQTASYVLKGMHLQRNTNDAEECREVNALIVSVLL